MCQSRRLATPPSTTTYHHVLVPGTRYLVVIFLHFQDDCSLVWGTNYLEFEWFLRTRRRLQIGRGADAHTESKLFFGIPGYLVPLIVFFLSETLLSPIYSRSHRWFKWLISNSPCLSPGFEPQVGRMFDYICKKKKKKKKDSIVENALQRA